jgi:hypothetical protein
VANSLTGDYEAAVQIAIRQINGLLGTLHQNGATADAALQLPHSAILRIADRQQPVTGGFEDWVMRFQRASPGRGLRDIRTQLTSTAPPGAARMLTEAFNTLYESWGKVLPPPGTLRGLARLQVSSPTITVPVGSSSEITVYANIRAAYYPDPGTPDLPAPIHGVMQAAFEVRKSLTSLGARLLISPSSDDSKIQFIAAPGSGLSSSDQNTLGVQVRNVLREQMSLLPVDLPADFQFTDFKGLGSAPDQVIALPFQLSGAVAPASGVQPLNQVFIGPSGFAVAVSKDYVSGLIDVEAIGQTISSQPLVILINLYVTSVSVTFHLSFTSGPTLTFTAGGIKISGQLEVQSNIPLAPTGSVNFTQLVTLALDTSSQTVTLVRAGDPTVDQSWFIPHNYVVNIVKSQIDAALAANMPSVRDIFTNARNKLVQGLNTFDPFASVSFTDIEITPDGVIVRGEVGRFVSVARLAPVVDIAETNQSTAFTAFESWVPAGSIDRFIWSWVEYPHLNMWHGVEKSFTDEDRFIFPKPTGVTDLSQICLRIEGTQISPGGWKSALPVGPRAVLVWGGLSLRSMLPRGGDQWRYRSGGLTSRTRPC